MKPGNVFDKFDEKYGFFGFVIVAISATVVLFGWIAASVVFPILFLVPLVILWWMVRDVAKDKSDE